MREREEHSCSLECDQLPVQLMGQNLVEQLETVESGKRLGGVSPILQRSMPLQVQGNDNGEEALRLPSRKSATALDTTMASLKVEGRKPSVAIKAEIAIPNTAPT